MTGGGGGGGGGSGGGGSVDASDGRQGQAVMASTASRGGAKEGSSDLVSGDGVHDTSAAAIPDVSARDQAGTPHMKRSTALTDGKRNAARL